MPTYQSHCAHCDATGDVRLTFSVYDEVRGGTKSLLCNTCDGPCQLVFDPSSVQFVLKDGESGGWASKALKENRFRAKRREVMAQRERDHVFKPRLQPNFQGVETGTWRDAKELARVATSQDHGVSAADVVARTYDPLIKTGALG